MLRAIAFDLDGTLVDHDGAVREAVAAFYPEVAHRAAAASLEEFVVHWNATQEQFIARYLAGEISFAEQRVRRVQHLLARDGAALSDDEAAALFTRYLAVYERSWRCYDDVLPCLQTLAPTPLAIISNGDGEQQRQKLERTGLSPFFSVVVISGDLRVSKPDAAIFHHAAQALGVAPGELLYVGDRRDVDALAAHRAGLHGVWLCRAGDPTPSPEIATIASLRQLAGVVEGMGG